MLHSVRWYRKAVYVNSHEAAQKKLELLGGMLPLIFSSPSNLSLHLEKRSTNSPSKLRKKDKKDKEKDKEGKVAPHYIYVP
jgi:hypothetical protein